MAERKAGPVKPPVIEGTAREATPRPEPASAPHAPEQAVKPELKVETAPKPEAKAEPKPEPDPKPEPPRPAAAAPPEQKPEPPRAAPPPPPPPPPPRQRPVLPPLGPDWRTLGAVAIGGAILGTILTYLMGNLIALPSRTVPIADPTPRLAAQELATTDLDTRLSALEISAVRTQQSLDATIIQLDGAVTELRQSIADARAAIPERVTVDLSGIETELRTLRSRVDALAAGVSGDDAGAIAQSLETMSASLAAIGTRVDGVDGRLTAIDGTAASLRTDLEAARKLLNDHIAQALPTEVGPALRLPLILSGLETAFASGGPFSLELDALRSVMPDLAVTERLTLAAPDGLIRPDALQLKFESLLPDILAARSGSKGNWGEDALDWLKSLLALRPAADTEGDTPDAIVSRLEGAMQRRDYSAAATLLAALPSQMRDAAGTLGADIASHADAVALLAELRARALAGTEPAP